MILYRFFECATRHTGTAHTQFHGTHYIVPNRVDGACDKRHIVRLHPRHAHAAIAREVHVEVGAHRVDLRRRQPRVREHADLRGHVRPVAAIGRGRADSAQLVGEHLAHALHAARHRAQLAAPLLVERGVAEHRRRQQRAMQRRRGVDGTDDALLHLVRVRVGVRVRVRVRGRVTCCLAWLMSAAASSSCAHTKLTAPTRSP
eukprot:scaffold33106_cov70-Phaeocystis_antarctica.AAC.2